MRIKNLQIVSHKLLFGKPKRAAVTAVSMLAVLSLFGGVAAFGTAPETAAEAVLIRPIIAPVALPELAAPAPEDQTFTYQDRVERGDTVASLLARLNVDDQDALQFMKRDPVGKEIFQLKPGKTVQADVSEAGELLRLRYLNQRDSVLVVERHDDDQFVAEEKMFTETARVVMKSGVIQSSLFAATDLAGIPDAIATQIATIFSTDIDFHSDLRRGDEFAVVYEIFYDRGEPVRVGRVLAAEFVNGGKSYGAIYFQAAPNQGSYYTPEGKTLRKAFLRSPLEFSRVSSGFSLARFHPIFKNWRAHTGVDFAAPTGTRVLATADGIVDFAGQRGGYGNAIELKHPAPYSTLYAHLSAFASGIRRGVHVQQGDVIGYVGATGWATGPHLHYEFKVAGAYRDPLGVSVPLAMPLAPQYQSAFRQTADIMQSKLALVRNTKLAQFE
jgi:murein DD-endopeptidase MepM/ murein hydrolase activator NlpD